MPEVDERFIAPCPDPDCHNGYIMVRNIYNPDPLEDVQQNCDLCDGEGYIWIAPTVDRSLN